MMIHFPYLDSDALVVLDCYVEEVAGTASLENITFLLDDDNSWARYLVLFAGYTNPSARPSKLSEILVSLLGDLGTSRRFYAREELITSQILQEKLDKEVRFVDELNLRWFGNDGKDFIHISPLQTS